MIETETNVYCDNCNKYNRHPIKDGDIICRDCYEELQYKLDKVYSEIESLKSDIKYYEEEIAKLETFKEEVINSPDCPKRIASKVVAERL